MWRKVAVGVLSSVALGLLVYLYPVGGAVWSAERVERLALVTPSERLESADRLVITEGMQAARLDRFRRVIPSNYPCRPVELQFQQGSRWITAQIRCASGLLFDWTHLDPAGVGE